MSSKRVRGKNFSEQEKHALIDLVLLNKDILQDKKKDAATWRRKAETWKRLTIEFRAQTGTDRSCAALREKYDNMKKNFRNKYRGVKNWDKEKEPNSAGNSWCSMSSTSENNEFFQGKYGRHWGTRNRQLGVFTRLGDKRIPGIRFLKFAGKC
ncbi:uncharacterized protein LOC108114001 isoform X3 [Drosophila eugracilis]|uniref:uncharacterized protein LOC108114001 isoform X3 n=1 Tax=Drosophila eugracilis TaxID=29029 RepID=UPI0007E7D28F|nr:uncharacterized protein LOC108114001 isoform X3 [Drosophila eugracilis]